ncbi:nucleoside-diphosphate kinase [Plantactinospora soyae]|uniref:Nucleoside diphosphate kinase n=1 Tax=Plantactinospora soyae TaxID=1544732 RepID=A0A927MKL3_9ACTN|nr:nucleoside-diphosphate kinase [Plantactinospora soyae]MBE1492895.1 nucleoside-diphosphate kinase [Plantactinospora soyae]
MTSSGSAERTLVLIKPDGVRRRLVSEILGRFERKGLGIDALALRRIDDRFADQHYADHLAAPFYPGLRAFMTSGPLVALVLSGDDVVRMVRGMVGATDGRRAVPGTIRGDFATSGRENLVHAADSADGARREIALWFPDLD